MIQSVFRMAALFVIRLLVIASRNERIVNAISDLA